MFYFMCVCTQQYTLPLLARKQESTSTTHHEPPTTTIETTIGPVSINATKNADYRTMKVNEGYTWKLVGNGRQ